jgi:hypothetical protein
MFDQGFSDGLPLVPPTPERVLRMLAGTTRYAQDSRGRRPPNMAPATVEKIAINAGHGGCGRVPARGRSPAVEAVCTDEFNMHGVTATTMGASPVLVVNGPIRQRIGMNMKLAALGNGNRANATIGRALRLVVRNVGGAKPGGVDRSTLSSPMKFTMCFAEWEEGSPWDPAARRAGISARGLGRHRLRHDQRAGADRRPGVPQPDQIAGTLGLGLEACSCPRFIACRSTPCWWCVPSTFAPSQRGRLLQGEASRADPGGHPATAAGDGCRRRIRRWHPAASAAKMTEAQLAAPVPKFADPKFITSWSRVPKPASSRPPSTDG